MTIAPLKDETVLGFSRHKRPTHATVRTLRPLHAVPAPVPTDLSAEDIVDLVALHVASTLLPPTAKVTAREQVRQNWRAHLVAVMDVFNHPQWAMAYVPGVHHGDNEIYAIHLPTGRVFGGDDVRTAQQCGESTHHWLSRLTADLPALADHQPTYRPFLEGA